MRTRSENCWYKGGGGVTRLATLKLKVSKRVSCLGFHDGWHWVLWSKWFLLYSNYMSKGLVYLSDPSLLLCLSYLGWAITRLTMAPTCMRQADGRVDQTANPVGFFRFASIRDTDGLIEKCYAAHEHRCSIARIA